jgi:hypothetical protein
MAKFSWGRSGSIQQLKDIALMLSSSLGGATTIGGNTTVISGSETIDIRAPANKTTAMTIGTADNTYVTINDHPAAEAWVFWNDVQVYDDTKLQFGAAGPGDSYIEYISATDTLMISASATSIQGPVGISTASPVVELDVTWNSVNDPSTFAGGASNAGGGERVHFATGSTSQGALYYLNESNGWTSASAAATGSGNDQMLGIAMGTDAQNDGMLIRGWFNATTYYSGTFRAGKAVYINSGTAGYMSGGAPNADNSYSRIIGHAGANANLIYFNPGSNWIELTGS